MSSPSSSFLHNPRAIINDCFLGSKEENTAPPTTTTTATAAAAPTTSTDPQARLEAQFRTVLQQPGALASIPLLNPSTWKQDFSSGSGGLKNHSLVRFRGMVQDMLDPQFFVGVHKNRASGRLLCTMYTDSMGEDDEEGGMVERKGEEGAWEPYQTMERRPLILGPIPGEAPWVSKMLQGQTGVGSSDFSVGSSGGSGNKRSLEEGEDVMMTGVGGEREEGATVKMPRVEEKGGHMMDTTTTAAAGFAAAAAAAAAATNKEQQQQQEAPFRCLTYLYGAEEEGGPNQQQPPKLNEAVEVIAVLSFTPDSEKENMMDAGTGHEGEDPDLRMEKLLLSLEPRLHVLVWERAGLLPFSSSTIDAEGSMPFTTTDPSSIPRPITLSDNEKTLLPKARAELLTHFTHALGGDSLTAEYLLLTLLSRVRLRSAVGEVVGHLPLNLSRVRSPNFAQGLAQLVESVYPRSRLLDITIATLGDENAWIPKKNYETNVLSTTALQAAPGTVLLLDESKLETGRLTAEGVANVRCIKTLMESMKTFCNFGFYQLDFEADTPLVIVSKSRSIFHGGAVCEVPLTCDNTQTQTETETQTPASLEGLVAPETLQLLRRYLVAVAGYPVEIEKELALQAEQEYVSLRGTEGGKYLTPEDLSRWLTLTRLLAASVGEKVVRKETHWARMKEMEEGRMQRVRVVQGDKGVAQ